MKELHALFCRIRQALGGEVEIRAVLDQYNGIHLTVFWTDGSCFRISNTFSNDVINHSDDINSLIDDFIRWARKKREDQDAQLLTTS